MFEPETILSLQMTCLFLDNVLAYPEVFAFRMDNI